MSAAGDTVTQRSRPTKRAAKIENGSQLEIKHRSNWRLEFAHRLKSQFLLDDAESRDNRAEKRPLNR